MCMGTNRLLISMLRSHSSMRFADKTADTSANTDQLYLDMKMY